MPCDRDDGLEHTTCPNFNATPQEARADGADIGVDTPETEKKTMIHEPNC